MSPQKLNILIIDDIHPVFFEQYGMERFNITYLPTIESSQVAALLKDQDILIVRSKVPVNEDICKHANRLKLIVRAGSGLDNIDTKWLQNKGIALRSTPEANAQAVAEHSLAMLLSLMAKIVKSDKEVRNRIWDREQNRGEELEGKTIGIIGFGHTGTKFAKVLGGFGVKILVYDKYKSGFSQQGVIEADMDELFCEADILSLHIPLTSETFQMVDKAFINRFSKPIRLLNLSRGGVVKLYDVQEALSNQKILGFGADVLPNENIKKLNTVQLEEFDRLCQFDNVILTPHIGGWTHQSYYKISESLALKINEFVELELKANPV